MNEDKRLSPLAAEMVAGLSAFCDALEAGEPVGKRFTVRTVSLDIHPKPYGPDDVKEVRRRLGASQALLAEFLGVSVKTLRSWEQGSRPVPMIACRYLDDLVAYPQLWIERVKVTTNQD
ncbi:helix-turn-helix domain-containing protein [Tautonia sp. JC769]|uniref:helix-turn-helix domain-containing protein n=1 Tax=Tautonia sp. JC769 TaxID=3232135 RepID=UPI0034586E2F